MEKINRKRYYEDYQWTFLFKDAEGNNTLSNVVRFKYPVPLSFALTFTTQFVRDNFISAQSFGLYHNY